MIVVVVEGLETLLPHLAQVVVEQVDRAVDGITVRARAGAQAAACTGCGVVSARVHGRYTRRLADAALGGQQVVIELVVRRFRCVGAGCAVVTFAEQVAGLTSPYARYTPVLRGMLTSIGLALAGRAGSRLAERLGIVVGRDTLLSLVRALADPPIPAVPVLGVDDFALKRGHVYATVLVDMATHQPIDVLADREAETLAAWLRRHPGVQIVCRDRAGAYANGVTAGAPDAVQVADRFHLWKNLCEAASKTVTAHYGCLRLALVPQQHVGQAETSVQQPPVAAAEPVAVALPERRLVTRTRERFEAVHSRLATGLSRSAISRELNLDIQTVRRFANATSLEPLLVNCQNRSTNLDGFIGQVSELWNAGLNGEQITERIRALGFTGSVQSVRRHLRPYRIEVTPGA